MNDIEELLKLRWNITKANSSG